MITRLIKALSVLIFVAITALALSSHARAATLNVVSGTDAINANGQCQLSEAIQNINDQAATNADCVAGDGNSDTINLPSGTVTLSGDLPELVNSVIVQGLSEAESIIDGGSYRAEFWNESSTVASISVANLTMNNGFTSGVNATNSGVFTQLSVENVSLNNATSYMDIRADNSNEQANIQNITINAPNSDPYCRIYIGNETSGMNTLIDTISINECGGASILTNASNNFPSQITLRDIVITNSNGCDIRDSRESVTTAIYAYTLERALITGCTGTVSISNRTDLNTENSTYIIKDISLIENSMVGGSGLFVSIGAFSASSAIDIQRVTIANNSTLDGTSRGEIIFNILGSTSSIIRNITFANNTSVTNSDQYPNTVGVFLGQIGDNFPMQAENITLTDNHATNNGSGGGYNGIGMQTIDGTFAAIDNIGAASNVLLSNNTFNGASSNCTASNPEFFGSNASTIPVSAGGNISDDASCTSSFTQPTDKNNVASADLKLGTLGDYGGGVPTIPLSEGSIAIDSGVTVAGLTTDARGVTRPQCATYDSGAYEYNSTCPAPQQLTYPDSEKGTTVSLILPSDVTSPSVSAVDPDTIPKDGDSQFPVGLTTFQFTTTPGATKTVMLYYDLPGSPNDYMARKYKTNSQTFIDVPGATITREDYNGKSMLKLTYSITDGGILDQDGLANGTVIDPVGLATTNLASTGENLAFLILAAGTLMTGGVWLSRKALKR